MPWSSESHREGDGGHRVRVSHRHANHLRHLPACFYAWGYSSHPAPVSAFTHKDYAQKRDNSCVLLHGGTHFSRQTQAQTIHTRRTLDGGKRTSSGVTPVLVLIGSSQGRTTVGPLSFLSTAPPAPVPATFVAEASSPFVSRGFGTGMLPRYLRLEDGCGRTTIFREEPG